MTLAQLVAAGGDRVEQDAAFGARTTYRVGGTVRVLVTLQSDRDLDELGPLIESTGLDVIVLGNGSNLLVADGEHDIVGVHLEGQFGELTWRDEGASVVVEAGAALDLPVAARRLSDDGVIGFEWAVGVPGTFGGAAVMNAGGHGSNMAASVARVHTWRDGEHRTWTLHELKYDYRTSALPSGEIVTGEGELRRPPCPELIDEDREGAVRRRRHRAGDHQQLLGAAGLRATILVLLAEQPLEHARALP